VVRGTRAYLAGLGTAGALVLGAALLFVTASAIVAFRGWPGSDRAPAAARQVLAVAPPHPHTRPGPVARRLAAVAAHSRAGVSSRALASRVASHQTSSHSSHTNGPVGGGTPTTQAAPTPTRQLVSNPTDATGPVTAHRSLPARKRLRATPTTPRHTPPPTPVKTPITKTPVTMTTATPVTTTATTPVTTTPVTTATVTTTPVTTTPVTTTPVTTTPTTTTTPVTTSPPPGWHPPPIWHHPVVVVRTAVGTTVGTVGTTVGSIGHGTPEQRITSTVGSVVSGLGGLLAHH
jgi:hypothetical protein